MKVALTAEGTYPHQFGGVSVWCDQLIRRLPHHDFAVIPLVATGNEPMQWQLPANVRSVATIPLWGRPPTIPLRSRLARGRYEGMLGDLIDVLLSPPDQGQDQFTAVMHELFRYGQSRNLTAALSSETAVRLLAQTWQQRWPEIMPEITANIVPEMMAEDAPDQAAEYQAAEYQADQYPAVATGEPAADPASDGRTVPTLADGVSAMQLLEHALRPFSHPPAHADVVHAVTNGLGALPAFAAKWQYGTPIMLTEHGVYMREQYLHNRRPSFGWPVKDLYLRFLRRLCALGYREADVITPGNIYNQRWEIELGADTSRIRTVYNGIDPATFPVLSHEPDVPTISWAGRIDPVKDLETLLRAFSLVAREIPQAQLKIFGSAPPGGEAYLERCQAEAADLGISDQTSFEGRVPEIRDAYAAGHIVVLCSISEGFPYTLIEAMACGRACVATDVGGVTEAIGDVAGLVVPPRSPGALAEACLRLLRNDELRRTMGAAARARAVEHFTVDRAVDAFDEMYTALGGSADRTEAVRPAAPVADAGAVEAGHLDAKTGAISTRWIELPPEEEAATMGAPEPDPRQAVAAAIADDVTQIIPVPGSDRGGPESEHTLIMPRLNHRSADQADQEQTSVVPAPGDGRAGPESEHTLIMPKLNHRSADQADQEQTSVIPAPGNGRAGPGSEHTLIMPRLKDRPAGRADAERTSVTNRRPGAPSESELTARFPALEWKVSATPADSELAAADAAPAAAKAQETSTRAGEAQGTSTPADQEPAGEAPTASAAREPAPSGDDGGSAMPELTETRR